MKTYRMVRTATYVASVEASSVEKAYSQVQAYIHENHLELDPPLRFDF